MAGGRLAEYVFCSRKSEGHDRSGGRTKENPTWREQLGGDGPAIYHEQQGCGHDYSWDAQDRECGNECCGDRSRSLARAGASGAAEAPVGSDAHEVVAVKTPLMTRRFVLGRARRGS